MLHKGFSCFVGVILVVLVCAGCSIIGFRKTVQDINEEEVFDPLIYQDDIDLDAELFPGDKTISSSSYRYTPMGDSLTERFSESDTTGLSEAATKARQWIYQIEIFSSSSRQEVMEKRDEVMRRVEHPVFLVFEAPFYRIRVGSLQAIQEAGALRTEMKRMGYGSASSVRRPLEEE